MSFLASIGILASTDPPVTGAVHGYGPAIETAVDEATLVDLSVELTEAL